MIATATFLLLGWALVACSDEDSNEGGKNVCEKACDKLESCPGMQCTPNFDNCDSNTAAIAECVMATPCADLANCI